MEIDVHEVTTQFDRLLELVERGETVTINRDGKPVAELVGMRGSRFPLGAGREKRREDLPAAAGDEWWQPMTDRQVDAWVDGQ